MSFERNYTDFVAKLESLDAKIKLGFNRLRNFRLDWNSVRTVRAAFRSQLGLRKFFLELRKLLEDTTSVAIQVHSATYDGQTPPSTYTLCRKSGGGGWGRRSRYSQGEGTTYAREMACHSIPHWLQEEQARDSLNRFSKLATDADLLWNQSRKLFDLPDYIGIKQVMPLGGRAAYSALLACETGKINNNLAGEHMLFGWHTDNSRIAENLSLVSRAIIARKEKGGKAPSVTAGRNLLNRANYLGDNERSLPRRRARLRSANGELIFNTMLGSRRSDYASPYMLRVASQDRHTFTVRAKIAGKIMGDSNQNAIATLLTSPIERIGESDCYWAECLASNNGENCKTGVVLFRASWNDILHITADAKPAEYDPAEAHAAYALGVDAYRIYRVNDASEWYFENRERQRLRDIERNRTQAEREAIRRADLAKQVRTLRSLPVVSVADSTSRGNCYAGTIQWANQLGLDPATRSAAPGKLIARKWSQAHYPQPDRLGNVLRMAQAVTGE